MYICAYVRTSYMSDVDMCVCTNELDEWCTCTHERNKNSGKGTCRVDTCGGFVTCDIGAIYWHLLQSKLSNQICNVIFLCGTIFCYPRQLDVRDSMHINGFPSQTRDLLDHMAINNIYPRRTVRISLNFNLTTAQLPPKEREREIF